MSQEKIKIRRVDHDTGEIREEMSDDERKHREAVKAEQKAKQAAMEKARQENEANGVHIRHFKNNAVTFMSRAVAEKYLRKQRGRIVRPMPEIRIDIRKELS